MGRGRGAHLQETLDKLKDQLSDRTQWEIGQYEDKVIRMDQLYGPCKSLDLDGRLKRWSALTAELRNGKFRKNFYGQIGKRTNVKNVITPAIPHIALITRGKFGMPLQKFPEHKYNYYKIVLVKDTKYVDYSVDEYDMEWMSIMNTMKHKLGQEIFSVAIFEFWLDRLEKMCIWKPKEHLKLTDENGQEVDDVCNICLDGDTSNCNQIVYCDRCNLAVHQDCYGLPFIPDGCLECRRCGISPAGRVHCVLCPSTTGAFKQVDHNRWVHVLCVIWVDETHFGNTIFMENVQNVERALHDRRGLTCLLCKNRQNARMGACIQCSEAKCTASFHVTCARNSGLVMRINETEDGHVNRFVWCMKHTPPLTDADREMKKLMLRNARRENERKGPSISMPTLTTSIIAKISSEQPVSDYREIVYFWYQKRQNRLGAPLLKNYTPETRPEKPRRVSRSSTLKNMESCEMRKQMKAIKESLESAVDAFDMIVRREDMKKNMLNSYIRMFERGFKPTELLCAEVVEALKKIDAGKVFAEPVNLVGYTDIIKNPICLRDMNEKAASGKYSTVTELAADVQLMLSNCATFNKGNRVYIKYGNTYRKDSTPILDIALKEEAERLELKNDEKFMTQLLNGVMTEYKGWSVKKEDMSAVESIKKTTSSVRRGRRHMSSLRVEELDDTDEPSLEMDLEEVPKRSTRKRGNQEMLEEADAHEESKQSTSASTFSPNKCKVVPAICQPSSEDASKSWFSNKKRGSLETPKNNKKSVESTLSSSFRQTTLTNFFGTTPRPQQTVTFADMASTSKSSQHSLFDTPSTSKSTLFSVSRPSTRSTSIINSTITPKTVNRKNAFRISSAAIQSPLPTTKKIGVRQLDSDNDDDEIVIQPPPLQLTAEELRAEKLKSAENEAMSKFAHNQLVIVDGRAAKVIESNLAHLSTDIHHEQRQSMMKKRREVLSEIPQSAVIYVEFFQKSNTLENFLWVTPDKVELLDLNNISQKSPKIPGLKAAREWHQKVLNGEDV